MGAAVTLNLILIGLAVAVDPLPLTAFMVVLASKNGVRKGAAFVFGWLVSMAVVVAVTILATGNDPPKPNTVPSLAALAVKIAIGAWLVWIAVRRHRTLGQPKEPKKPPKWQASVDSMSPWFAMALAPALQPWVLLGAGVATVMEAKLSTPASFIALILYCVIGSSTYLGMEIYAAVKPRESQEFLARIQTWIADHTDQVIVYGSLILGFWLIANSLYIVLQ